MSKSILDTGIKLVKNVGSFSFGAGSLAELAGIVDRRRDQAAKPGHQACAVYFVDEFFRNRADMIASLGARDGDRIEFVSTKEEPKTEIIDQYVAELHRAGITRPVAVIGVGGGTTMDTGKAVSNLLANGGLAEHYQGWDLVKVPGIYKIGVPTISGTGSEATRTCVMTNTRNGLKLGMNSDFTVFDMLILDPDLTSTVPRNQYFYTGMDAYIHCMEAMAGSYRNPVGDAYSRESIRLCRQVFQSDDMMNSGARADLMVASYLGGCAIATSYVGVVHPFSAGLSVVLGLHHCVANCIALRALAEFYPEGCREFLSMADRQGVAIPEGVCRGLGDDSFHALYEATIVHEKPLTNALGSDFRAVLNYDRVRELFRTM